MSTFQNKPNASKKWGRRTVFAAATLSGALLVSMGAPVANASATVESSPGIVNPPAPQPDLAKRLEQGINSLPTPAEGRAAKYDLDSPESVTVVVNKLRPLADLTWAPNDLVIPNGVPNQKGHALRAEAATALEQMYAAANSAGVPFILLSGFRSYETQTELYAFYTSRSGSAQADLYSARPGYSEHQTGLAVDLDDFGGCTLRACFGEGGAGVWLRENAHQYGFILRYQEGQTDITGYNYEPWHFRYVGTDLATKMYTSGEKNLETFFGLPAAPQY